MSEEAYVEKTVYHSFLLRLWSIRQNGQISWRASLENPHTKQQQFFDCLEDLIGFLQQLNQDQDISKDAY